MIGYSGENDYYQDTGSIFGHSLASIIRRALKLGFEGHGKYNPSMTEQRIKRGKDWKRQFNSGKGTESHGTATSEAKGKQVSQNAKYILCMIQIHEIWRIKKIRWKSQPVKRTIIWLVSQRPSAIALITGMSTLRATICFRRTGLGEKVMVSPTMSNTHIFVPWFRKKEKVGTFGRKSWIIFKEVTKLSKSYKIVLIEDLNFLDICWKKNTTNQT